LVTIAYLANQYPAASEPYVAEEIEELRRRGARVLAGSVRRPQKEVLGSEDPQVSPQIIYLQPLRILAVLRALILAMRRWKTISCFLRRVLLRGNERLGQRAKGLLHTWLGACFAVQLRESKIDHIHVHHGYFGAWVGMVAARLLGVSYSLTLHGSDLLLNRAYLDTKLEHCAFCTTISEYNRHYLAKHFPLIEFQKINVLRLGVDVTETLSPRERVRSRGRRLKLISIGRLQAVKDHGFLIRACAQLQADGLDFECGIVGEGPQRPSLEFLTQEWRLKDRVALLGSKSRRQVKALYEQADVVVLTSRSEGIPLVLMEAMAQGRIVLAPAITGIPELVIPGKTGFLYAAGAQDDFIQKIFLIHELLCTSDHSAVSRLDWMRHAGRVQVLHNFNRSRNLALFSDRFLQLISTAQTPN
jgi:colanic acid/amylovoran biosynthesis glycosyltransferase